MGILYRLLFFVLKWAALGTKSISCPLLTTVLQLIRYLKTVYRPLHFFAVEAECNALNSPSVIMCFLQLGAKHIFSSWWAKYDILLTKSFSYVFAEKKLCFEENFVERLSNTCKITATIWLLNLVSSEKIKKNIILQKFVQSC